MKFGLCDQTLVPVRIQPGDRQEMINQLLFGDLFEIRDKHNEWLLIDTADDHYDGWVDEKQVAYIDQDNYNELLTTNRFYVKPIAATAKSDDQKNRIILTMGARLPRFDGQRFVINKYKFNFTEPVIHVNGKSARDVLTQIALNYKDAPYLWGGRSPFGIDCSGFTQIVFKMCGKFLPRDSAQQVHQGKTINFINEAEPGDLAFFGEEEGNIVHVGIIMDENQIIHASGKVRIDKIDHHGIFHVEKQKYTHSLRVIKSFF